MDTFDHNESTPEQEQPRPVTEAVYPDSGAEPSAANSQPGYPQADFAPPPQPEPAAPTQFGGRSPKAGYYAPPIPGQDETWQTPPSHENHNSWQAGPSAPSESPAAPQPEQGAYRGGGAGRKESPYASSPYMMNHQQAQQEAYQYQPQTQPPRKPKSPGMQKPKRPIWGAVLSAVLTVALVAVGCLTTAKMVNEAWEERSEKTVKQLTSQINALQDQLDALARQNSGASVSGSPSAVDGGLTPSQVYAQNVDSVVAISCTVQTSGYYGTTQGTSTGSGFILSEDGYILTNYHVVESATSISVVMYNGEEYEASIVGYDSSANDLAVLKVDASGLPAAAIGSSDDLIIGDMVVAIGNPLGKLTSTQTVGYVSGIGREVATDSLTTIRMIQTDAAINPGNSGGPLFNMNGEVIGITTAKYSGTTTSGASIEGIGFAIPIDDVMDIIDDLINLGYVNGAYMGVSVQNTDESSASMFGLPTGAYIVSVEKDGAAYKAGIQAKDIIIDVGGYTVSNVTDLTRALRHFQAGDTTTVTVIRSGQQMTLEITLDAKPQENDTSASSSSPSMPSEGDYEDWYEYFRRYFGG